MIVAAVILYLVIGIFLASLYKEHNDLKNPDGRVFTNEDKCLLMLCIPFFWGLAILALPLVVVAAPFYGVTKLASYTAKELVNPKGNV